MTTMLERMYRQMVRDESAAAQVGSRSATKERDAMVEIGNDHDARKLVVIDYTNWRGERGMRTIEPIFMWWADPGANEYHPEGGWMLDASDMDKGGTRRTFDLARVHAWRPLLAPKAAP